MKNKISLAIASMLVLGAAIFFACQKDAPVPSPQPIESGTDKSLDRSGVCNNIIVARGVGLVICGSDTGVNQCTVCGQIRTSELVVTNPDNFGFTGSDVFSLYNPTGRSITAGLSFNCALQAPIWVTIASGATVSFTVAPDAQGCCQITPC